jgi:septum site-determining protein MinC
MAVFSNLHNKSGQTEKQTKTITPTTEQESESDSESTVTRVLTQPVRSGQRIYVKGDLVILSPVSSGAEIMAEGNIHVYGALRGRALAGVQGNTESRIFCSDLQSELVSIAGHYKVSEDLVQSVRGKPVQIYLQDKALIIKDI